MIYQLILILFSYFWLTSAANCPDGWNQSSTNPSKCYYFTTIFELGIGCNYYQPPDPPVQAKDCQGVTGATLVSIDSTFENSELAGYVKSDPNNHTYIIGLVRNLATTAGNTIWYWTNGDPSPYNNWAPSRASYCTNVGSTSDNDTNCAILLSDGTWDCINSYGAYPVICQYIMS